MEVSLYKNIDDKIMCTACLRYCRLSEGQTGYCGVRTNVNGHLNLSVYNMPYSFNIDPIEKKPVLHMYPGADILSFGTTGCNFGCLYCQNYDMSQRRKADGVYYTPEDVVNLAMEYNTDGIAYTYNEPTIFMEYARDIGLIARRHGLINIFVTNGYETDESMKMASEFLDAMTVDFKGNGNKYFYNKYISVPSAEGIFNTIKNAVNYGIHTEITDLIIPDIGDSLDDARKMLEKIMNIAGPYIPVSFLRYHPDYKLNIPETPLNTLIAHHDLAVSMGFKYVYLGNVHEVNYENTYCPVCHSLLISRRGFYSRVTGLDSNGRCKNCGYITGIKLLRNKKLIKG